MSISFVSKKILTCLLFVTGTLYSYGQTSNIGGIVNTYHKVVEILPSKACLRVADATGLVVNNLIMVAQMKGASINTANNSSFGDTTALNSAGNYEIGTICYIIGDSVFLFHQLLNSYDVSAKVQIVQFAEYYSANVTDTIKAAGWDSATGKGGVIAIYAEQTLSLNAPVYADSSGYSGGAWYNNNGTCNIIQQAGTGWAYDITAGNNLNGAYKGESVATISSTVNSAKGAPANGGGGGNNHNNSGGGGANLTAGGNGGGNSSSGPTGCNVSNNWGRGGKAMSTWGGSKIFLGGGGGAGHANNGSASYNYGGNGGGIIFIWANEIIGNGYSISANGGNGGASQSDGAGGGGAGGTIILNVNNYTGSLSVIANGGTGGLSDNGIVTGRCFGGGGGGSGGAIYFTGAVPGITVQANAGAAGSEINRESSCAAAVPASAGSNGSNISSYTFSRSTNTASYCQLLLPSRLLFFKAALINDAVIASWQVDHPGLVKYFTLERKNENNNWIAIKYVDAADNLYKYAAADYSFDRGNNFYRLKITEKDGTVFYSDLKKIWAPVGVDGFTVYPNPAGNQFSVTGRFDAGTAIAVLDATGRVVIRKNILADTRFVKFEGLATGIYFIKFKTAVQKLVVQ
jgi:hypothetical protein